MLLVLTISLKTLAQVTANLDTILKLNDSIPFMGVLVSPTRYREFSIEEMESKDFKSHLSNYVVCPVQTPKVNLFSSFGYGFIVSVGVLAFISGAVFEHNH